MSYAGHFAHAASGRLHRRLRRQFPWIRTVLLQPRFKHRLEGKVVELRSGAR
jgi:hypothetical protein